MPVFIKIPNYPKWLCIHEYSSEGDMKVTSFGHNDDSALISSKCPWEKVLASGKTAIWLTSLLKAGHFIWEWNWDMKGPSVYLARAHSPHLLYHCGWNQHNKILSQCTQIICPELPSFSTCLYCHCFMKLCECRLWLVVLENSQGEEPFISQASAITEAYSHRHNHLLKLLEIGSPKRYGLGVHHSIQGNLCRCHSSKIIFSVFAESLGGNICPFIPTGQSTWRIYFSLPLSYKIHIWIIAKMKTSCHCVFFVLSMSNDILHLEMLT